MGNRLFVAAAAFAAFSGTMTAQNQTRRMTSVGGGAPDRGKCTIEVVVDGAAEVEIRGNTATLRNLSGAAPQWRRFECTGPLPSNPGNFRFTGVDGRGRQQLIHDPRSGGSALVRIDDPDGGSEGYTFDITWGNGWGNAAPPPPPFQSQDRARARAALTIAASIGRVTGHARNPIRDITAMGIRSTAIGRMHFAVMTGVCICLLESERIWTTCKRSLSLPAAINTVWRGPDRSWISFETCRRADAITAASSMTLSGRFPWW